MTSRILFLAYHYPPENAIGAARPFRFVKYLQRQGHECHVITAAPATAGGITSIPDPFSRASRKGAGFQMERLVRKFFLPGALGTQWSQAAYHAGLDYIRSHPGERITIFSTFPPVGVQFAAYRLAGETGLPWMADFRDPMGHNPIYVRLGARTGAAYRFIERRIVERADAIIANTDASQSILQSAYPTAVSKIHLLWNGFDPEQRLSPLPLPARSHRVYTHTGELYEGRTIAPLLESFQRLFQYGRIAPDHIHVDLIGPAEGDCLPSPAFLECAQRAGWLSITPRQIPKCEAQQAAQTADGLLIVQPQSAVQVPGKVYDYLQIGRPILAYVPSESAVERLLAKAGVPYRCVYTAMPPDVFDDVLLDYLKLPSDPVSASEWFEETFNAVNQTACLASIVESIQRR